MIHTKGVNAMLIYEPKLLMDVSIDRPDFQNFLLLDRELHGTRIGMQSAVQYIRDSFMILNDDFRFMYMQMGIKAINHMELLADVIHKMHGVDDRYYDEDNDDTPAFELIPPLTKEEGIKEMEQHHVNNDITACTMFHMQEEERQIQLYQELDKQMEDQGAHAVFSFIIEGKQENLDILKGILNTLREPNEIKDFGLDATLPNAYSLNSGNYFGKLNPEFLNPSEQKKLP